MCPPERYRLFGDSRLKFNKDLSDNDADAAAQKWQKSYFQGRHPDGADGPEDHQLKNLAIPALFMTAAHDPNSTPAMSEAMADHTPLGRACTVPASAHMMPMTHAGIAASQMLQTFGEAS